jgi:hypothetical protein
MRFVVFSSQAGNTVSWTVDEDCTVVGVSGGGHVFSSDPSLTFSNFFTPTADAVEEKFALSPELLTNLSFDLQKGDKIFAAPTGSSGNVSILHLIPQLRIS